jgi:hypothetical protein
MPLTELTAGHHLVKHTRPLTAPEALPTVIPIVRRPPACLSQREPAAARASVPGWLEVDHGTLGAAQLAVDDEDCRRGRATSSPAQFGQIAANSVAQLAQKVHS